VTDALPQVGTAPLAPDEMQRVAQRGRPSYTWAFGQERRFRLMLPYLAQSPAPMLDIGCGVGVYVKRFRQQGIPAFGADLEWDHLSDAAASGTPAAASPAEALPFADDCFGTVLLHEVIEHFADDAAALREAVRVTRPGGRLLVFAPNRLYPFETHGVYWRGRYIYGNIPLVGYLPDGLRQRLCPHVRAYTVRGLRELLAPLPVRTLVHVQIYPGYDKISRRQPRLAGAVRGVTYLLENTPLRVFGLSHFIVLEKLPA